MNHFVPDFDADDDYFIPGSSSSSSSLNLTKKSAMAEDDIMELLWHNGQVVIQSQTQQRPNTKKSSSPAKLGGGVGGHASELGHTPPPPLHQQPSDQHHVFIQEDEMASWLHYPLHDDDFCSDLLYCGAAPTSASQPPQSVTQAPPEKSTNQVTATKPPPAPLQRKTENEQRTVRNFVHFSRLKGSNTSVVESGPSIPKAVARESPAVDSSDTQSAVGSDAIKRTARSSGRTETRGVLNGGRSGSSAEGGGASSSAVVGVRRKDVGVAREASATSSTRVSTGREEPIYIPPAKESPSPADDRKRKGRETDEVDGHSEDTKQGRGLTSTKRSRAAEVHNLSERRRRDRINEKMRALQELIPRCNKSDKASMLDEAIEYLKSLQLQVQMMSMGCGMVPMMYPGMQHYMPHMAMGMGMNRPLTPFPFPHTLTPPHMGGPRLAVPPFPVPHVQASDPSRVHVTNQPDAMLHLQRPNQSQVPGFLDHCQQQQQLLGLHPMQAYMVQSQATAEPSSSKPSNNSREPEDQENHPAPAV